MSVSSPSVPYPTTGPRVGEPPPVARVTRATNRSRPSDTVPAKAPRNDPVTTAPPPGVSVHPDATRPSEDAKSSVLQWLIVGSACATQPIVKGPVAENSVTAEPQASTLP